MKPYQIKASYLYTLYNAVCNVGSTTVQHFDHSIYYIQHGQKCCHIGNSEFICCNSINAWLCVWGQIVCLC